MKMRMLLINAAAIVGICIAFFFVKTSLPLWVIGMIVLSTFVGINVAAYHGAKRDNTTPGAVHRSKAGLVFMWIVILIALVLKWLNRFHS